MSTDSDKQKDWLGRSSASKSDVATEPDVPGAGEVARDAPGPERPASGRGSTFKTLLDRMVKLNSAELNTVEKESLSLFVGLRVTFFLAVLAALIFLAWDADALFGNGFNPFLLFASAERPTLGLTSSTQVTFLSDLPSMVLSLTAASGLITYCIIGWMRRNLRSELEKSRIIYKVPTKANGEPRDDGDLDDESKAIKKQIDVLFEEFSRSTRRKSRLNALMLGCSLAIGVFFYWLTANYGFLFTRLRELSGGVVSIDHFRQSWWASKNWILALSWILLGSLGFWSAAMQGIDYLKLANLCVELGDRELLNHVPVWVSTQYGWRPIMRLVDLKVVGFVTGLIAILPAAYFVYGAVWYRVLPAAVLPILLIVWNLRQVGAILKIPRIHREIVGHRLELVRDEIEKLAPDLGGRTPILPCLSGVEYAQLNVWLVQAQQLNAALDVRMQRYVKAAALYGPLIGALYVAGAVITILTLF